MNAIVWTRRARLVALALALVLVGCGGSVVIVAPDAGTDAGADAAPG